MSVVQDQHVPRQEYSDMFHGTCSWKQTDRGRDSRRRMASYCRPFAIGLLHLLSAVSRIVGQERVCVRPTMQYRYCRALSNEPRGGLV